MPGDIYFQVDINKFPYVSKVCFPAKNISNKDSLYY